MIVVIGSDTLRSDSVYTRMSSNGRYQISAIDSLGRMVLLKMFDFQGEALYPLFPLFPPNEFVRNSIEVIDYNGASWLNFSDPEGFINVTGYTEDDMSVSGSFGGPLQNTANSGETLTIDTAYFENVYPIVLNTEPGRADVFNGGRLTRNMEATAVLSAAQTLMIQSLEDPYGEGFMLWLNDASPTEVTRTFFAEGPLCYAVQGNTFEIPPIVIDSASQTVSGELRIPLSDVYLYFNQVPVEFPNFPIESDQLNLYYNNEVIPFEDYDIISSSGTLDKSVTFSAWSTSGAYLEGTLENEWDGNLFSCSYLFFSGSLSLYENENSSVPLATFQGLANLTATILPQTLAEMGFTGDEAELSGINLEVTFVE